MLGLLAFVGARAARALSPSSLRVRSCLSLSLLPFLRLWPVALPTVCWSLPPSSGSPGTRCRRRVRATNRPARPPWVRSIPRRQEESSRVVERALTWVRRFPSEASAIVGSCLGHLCRGGRLGASHASSIALPGARVRSLWSRSRTGNTSHQKTPPGSGFPRLACVAAAVRFPRTGSAGARSTSARRPASACPAPRPPSLPIPAPAGYSS